MQCSSLLLVKFHHYSLQPTTGLTTRLEILFWKCSERKECSKILKIFIRTLQNCSFFSNDTGFLTIRASTKKSVVCEYSEILGNILWSSSLQKQALTGSLHYSCKQLFGKLKERAVSVLKKDSAMEVSPGSFQRFSDFFFREHQWTLLGRLT